MNIIPNILLLLTVAIAPVKQENTVRYDANTVNSLQIQKCSICNDTVMSKQNTVNTCDYQIQIKVEKTANILQEKETVISKIRLQNTDSNYSIVKSYGSFSTADSLYFNRCIANNAFQDKLMYSITNKYVITNRLQSLIYNTYLLDSHKISIASTILYDVMLNSL